ncbi:LytR/AlgR family response regulator transcription factor [Konateibacter massiliensis]|uniref:LytR/AlgR family response regulator transcription factor n=1 Tax=Konateibacter massiliensis TaxID=2002841 RepID=UPI000C154C48|nr:LytTR family DNA-binding domain-containing protein [Konateibacter massiliensis]
MVRVAIVEDNQKAADVLKKYFEKLQEEIMEEYQIQVFPNAASFLAQYHGNQELIMMDIEMPGINGMEAAAKLRKIDREVILVFVTNMAQYAVKGYEVDALDFIVKPVRYTDFLFKMKRVMYALQMKRQPQITIAVPGGMRRVDSARLLYVEVSGHSVHYHLMDEVITVRGTLSKVEEQLAECHFFKCNNCYLVNPRHIVEVQGYVVKVGNEELQISHPRKKAFMQALNEWIASGGQS